MATSTRELLETGARAIAEMQELGLSMGEIEDMLAGGAQRVGRYARRGAQGRLAPAQKQTEVVIENGKAVIRPKAGNTPLRPAKERQKRPSRSGQSIERLPQPEITEQYVNAVRAGLNKANIALGEPRVIEREGQDPITVNMRADDFGQSVIQGGKKDRADKEARVLAEAGVLNLDEQEPDRAAAERYDGPSELGIKLREQQQADFEERKRVLRAEQPRFENVAGLRYGETPGEFAPPAETPLRSLQKTITQLEQAVASGQVDPNAVISIPVPASRRPLKQFTELYRDEEGEVKPGARPPKYPRTTADVPPVERDVRVADLLASLKSMTPAGGLADDKQQARDAIQRNPISQEIADRNQSDFVAEVEAERGRRRRGIFPAGNPEEDALRMRYGDGRRDDEIAIRNLLQVGQIPEEIGGEAGFLDTREPQVDRGLPIAMSNVPDTHQNLNAPQTASEFVQQQIQAEEGRAALFKDARIGDFEVDAPIKDLEARVAGLPDREMRVKGLFGIRRKAKPFNQSLVDEIGPIRSIGGLQKAADAILRVGGKAGVGFPHMVQNEQGRMVPDPSVEPGVGEVLDFLKMNAGEQQKLGLALNNLDLGEQNVVADQIVNAQQKQAFKQGEGLKRPDIVFGVKNLHGSGLNPEADIAIAPQKQARRFGQANEPDARRPFIGAVRGEVAPVRKAPGMMSPMEIERIVRDKADAGGYQVKEENIENAKIVAERARRDESAAEAKRKQIEADTAAAMFPAIRRRV